MMCGDGSTLRHPIFVTDAVRGLERCAACGEPGEVYFLAGEQPVSIEELVQIMARVLDVQLHIVHLPVFLGIVAGTLVQVAFKPLGRRPPISRRTIDFFLKDNAYDTGKAQRELGLQAQTDLAEGIRQTLVWGQKRNSWTNQ